MELVRNILIGIYAVVCLVLIILTMSQTKEDSGASGTIMGSSANNFYEKNKGRTKEGKLKKWTIILSAVFALLTIAIGILYVI